MDTAFADLGSRGNGSFGFVLILDPKSRPAAGLFCLKNRTTCCGNDPEAAYFRMIDKFHT